MCYHLEETYAKHAVTLNWVCQHLFYFPVHWSSWHNDHINSLLSLTKDSKFDFSGEHCLSLQISVSLNCRAISCLHCSEQLTNDRMQMFSILGQEIIIQAGKSFRYKSSIIKQFASTIEW